MPGEQAAGAVRQIIRQRRRQVCWQAVCQYARSQRQRGGTEFCELAPDRGDAWRVRVRAVYATCTRRVRVKMTMAHACTRDNDNAGDDVLLPTAVSGAPAPSGKGGGSSGKGGGLMSWMSSSKKDASRFGVWGLGFRVYGCRLPRKTLAGAAF